MTYKKIKHIVGPIPIKTHWILPFEDFLRKKIKGGGSSKPIIMFFSDPNDLDYTASEPITVGITVNLELDNPSQKPKTNILSKFILSAELFDMTRVSYLIVKNTFSVFF